ncbi:MAG: nicotinamide mononucleotide transporter [Bacteroidaceae bacterium]|nr:nicotinamide mononucleotide transporter [Bacteroidaceae bacterium]
MDFLIAHWLDIFTTLLGLLYIALEYKASIWLWLVGIVMPALDIWLYWSHGLYGDAGMAAYYTLAGFYGFAAWKVGQSRARKGHAPLLISHFPRRLWLPVGVVFVLLWVGTYAMLVRFTNSTIPVTDAFTNALSFVGLWLLSRKYIEQWVVWIIVDVVSTYLYVTKGIPFKAGLYGLYVIIAIMGYRKWKLMMS